jgi:hypothetical protein
MTLDETVESYIGLVDMFFRQFLIFPYVKDSEGKVKDLRNMFMETPASVLFQRAELGIVNRGSDYVKLHFIFIGDYLSGIVTKAGVRSETYHHMTNTPDFDSKFREYCLVQMQKYHKSRDEAMYTVSKLDEFTPFSYEVVRDKHILKNLKTGGIIEPYKNDKDRR